MCAINISDESANLAHFNSSEPSSFKGEKHLQKKIKQTRPNL